MLAIFDVEHGALGSGTGELDLKKEERQLYSFVSLVNHSKLKNVDRCFDHLLLVVEFLAEFEPTNFKSITRCSTI